MIKIVTAAIWADRSSNPQSMWGVQGFPGSSGASGPTGLSGQNRLDETGDIISITVKPDNIGYFNPDLNKPKERPVINIRWYTFY